MGVAAVWVDNDPVELTRLPAPWFVGNPQVKQAWSDEVKGVFVPTLMSRLGDLGGEAMTGIRDDNRSALLPDHRVSFEGREYLLAVKGCGAAHDASWLGLDTVLEQRTLAARLELDDAAIPSQGADVVFAQHPHARGR